MSENSPFYNIVETGDLSELKKALEIYQINAKDEEGMSLLSWACVAGKRKMVSYLLENGANPNIKCKEGRTPLIYAACNNHPMIVKALLKAGANPKLGDKSGWTAETWADIYWNEKTKFILREHRKSVAYQKPKRRPSSRSRIHSR